MNRLMLQRQTELPASIALFRYTPERRGFLWESWDPSQVRTADDLPPYLIFGDLDGSTFKKSTSGWRGCWRGPEHDTRLEIHYLTHRDRYELCQIWRGLEGGFSTHPARIPLDRLIAQSLYMRFPSQWDAWAKERIERDFQMAYFEQSNDLYSVCGMPDGAFRTLAFPVAIKNLRPVREWLEQITRPCGLRYPIYAEAKMAFQAINYIEGKAPDWTTIAPVVFNHSLAETGTVPYGFPVKETAQDGSSAWTLRRDVYVLLISLPFAWLNDFLHKMSTAHGPIRYTTNPALRVELKPFVMPAAYELQVQDIVLWDKDRTTRCCWQFAKDDSNTSQAMQSTIDLMSTAENVLRKAEAVSADITRAIEQIMELTQGEKSMSTRVNERLQELMNLTVSERIDAVAADLEQQVPRYAEIPAHDLAQALDVPDPANPGADWSFVRYAPIISVEAYAEYSSLPSEIIYLIKDHVPTSRFEQLLACSSELDEALKPQFDFLTEAERSDLEHAIAEKELESSALDGMNCLAHFSVETSSGTTLAFEAVVEDDGSCIELRTPYDAKAGRFNDLRNCITDSW